MSDESTTLLHNRCSIFALVQSGGSGKRKRHPIPVRVSRVLESVVACYDNRRVKSWRQSSGRLYYYKLVCNDVQLSSGPDCYVRG